MAIQWNKLSALSKYLMLAEVMSPANTRRVTTTGVAPSGSVGFM